MRGFWAVLALLTITTIANPAGAADATQFDKQVSPFVGTYCLRCHDEKKQKGDFRLDILSRDFDDPKVAQRWGEILFRINAAEMPPKKEAQPSAQEIGQVADSILSHIKEGEAVRMAKRAPVALYRLSREEYGNSVYDLLGVYFDVNLPGAFNEDPRWHGFERIGSMLSLSPSHIERYFKAAETVLDRAFPAQQPAPTTQRRDAIEMRHANQRKRLTDSGIADKVRGAIWPGGSLGNVLGQVKEPGIYRARIKLSGLPGYDGRAPHLSVWHEELKRSIYDEDIIAAEDKPVVITFETFLSPPLGLSFHNEVPGAFSNVGNHTLNVLNSADNIFTGTRDTSRVNPTAYKLFDDEGHAIYPILMVDSVEWEGPLVSPADLKKREGLIPKKEGDLTEMRECLRRFATRAWRRPATDVEVDRYVKIVQSETQAGENFASSYRAAMIGILTSKNFYYLEEGSATEHRTKVTDSELASRLSYFLWSSMPDDELSTAAQAGQLHEQGVLKTQFTRMLGDAKIGRFTESFPRQWLALYRVGIFPPDPGLFPEYDKWLQRSMVLETTEFFNTVFRENLSIKEFLASDWTMVNPRLAMHYHLPALKESSFQKVKLAPENHRGGLLTQASILTLTSDGTRHRPVHRGVWLSEAIFGRTPPPPPPNVEPLEPTPANKPRTTIRAQIESHATSANCASCHQKIDPLGLAFDNFDAIGQWRTEERVVGGQGANPPVNATGKLPDGRAFNGPDEFKQLLVQDTDRFAEAFIEQLATYALRRVMTIDDASQIKAIAAASKKDGYALRTIVENLVMSDLFQKR